MRTVRSMRFSERRKRRRKFFPFSGGDRPEIGNEYRIIRNGNRREDHCTHRPGRTLRVENPIDVAPERINQNRIRKRRSPAGQELNFPRQGLKRNGNVLRLPERGCGNAVFPECDGFQVIGSYRCEIGSVFGGESDQEVLGGIRIFGQKRHRFQNMVGEFGFPGCSMNDSVILIAPVRIIVQKIGDGEN